jgi:hypothetical protein
MTDWLKALTSLVIASVLALGAAQPAAAQRENPITAIDVALAPGPVLEDRAAYVPKSSGENFDPHVAVGIRNAGFAKTMAAGPFDPIMFSPEAARIYQLGDYGTARKELKVLDQRS